VKKLREEIEKPFLINGNKLFISVSTGISLYPQDGTDSATLIRNADNALYRAKETGRNNYSFYDYEITKVAASRLEVENILRKAIDSNEFLLFYQPKIDLETGKVMGVEALIRLKIGDGKMLPPDEFIPIAEETGLIIPIGKWVLEQAIKQLVDWHAMGHALKVAVNISAVQIQRGDIVQTIRDLQNKYKFNANDVELEVTESVLIEFPERAVDVLNEVRKLGLTVALDDFGTGFSSLSNLKRYPITTIKIDKSFVLDILDDANDAAITRAVVAMGRSLDMQVVAEGVETAAHVKYLQELGCHQAQGYFYSRPVPADEFNRKFLSLWR
jgi:EAL domain-containing protein (putative c-di-GMP-specific phosphodiesterase class I)